MFIHWSKHPMILANSYRFEDLQLSQNIVEASYEIRIDLSRIGGRRAETSIQASCTGLDRSKSDIW